MVKYKEKWRLKSDNPITITSSKGNPVYDMYQIEITYNTKEVEVKKVFCEYGTIIDPKIKDDFFWWSLWGNDGLIKAQGRDDYIFLGRIENQNGEYTINRFYLMPDGKTTAQDYFDITAYPRIKDSIEQRRGEKDAGIQPIDSKETVNNSEDGKTYVIADIHGMYGSYMEAIQRLNENDTLVIIGDAIDRGPNGIAILRDIIARQREGKGPRIVFLLGNHEMQMIECLKILEKHRPIKDELEQLCEVGKFLYFNWNKVKKNESIAKLLEEQPYVNFSKADMALLFIWIKASQGQATFEAYDALSPAEQEEINEFLTKKSFIYAKSEIDNRNILFVHALPHFSQEDVECFRTCKEAGVKYSDIRDSKRRKELLSHCTEERDEKTPFKLWKNEGYYTIYGHTPTPGQIVEDEENGCLCIDAGCGQQKEESRLALYCINDGKVQYLEEKEEYKTVIPGYDGEQPR